jgi:DNA replication initiation complex subunit (GINS family)
LYNELYEIWKKEKENKSELQRLSNNFYSKIVVYIKKLKEENRMLDKKTIKAKLLDNEFKNVKTMVDELLFLRYKKLENAFSQETVARDALTEEEKKLFGKVSPLAEAYRAFSKDILRGRLSRIENDVKQTVVLRFVQEIPALVGVDMKTYGPFGPEDIANLPPENARILIKQGVAVEIDLN